MNTLPKVSIVIPVYNGANYLREAIDSALAQTYANKEIIVVNDGSTDNGLTEQIALSYGDKIRYFSKPNGGVASALNKAIAEMHGDYFSWLSHDDLYFPEKLAVQINALQKLSNPKTIIYSDFAFFQDNPQQYQEIRLPTVAPEQFRYFLTLKSVVHGCTLLIPKQAFLEFGGFNESLRYTQDYDLWFKLAEQYQFIHVASCLVKGRQHPGQDTVKSQAAAFAECDKMHSYFLSHLTSEELQKAENSLSLAYAQLACSLKQRSFNHAAKLAAKKAIRHCVENPVQQTIMTVFILIKAYWFMPLLIKVYPLWRKIKS